VYAKGYASISAVVFPSVHRAHDAVYINVAALSPSANVTQGALVKPNKVPVTPAAKSLVLGAVSKLARWYI
jgi:hypothetical protein